MLRRRWFWSLFAAAMSVACEDEVALLVPPSPYPVVEEDVSCLDGGWPGHDTGCTASFSAMRLDDSTCDGWTGVGVIRRLGGRRGLPDGERPSRGTSGFVPAVGNESYLARGGRAS